MKKIFSFMLIAAGLMVSAQSFAKKDYKFSLNVESGATVGAVVYDDYSFTVGLPAGATVDPASVTITIKMKNVASMGVEGERTATKTIATGIPSTSVQLTNWLSKAYAFGGATFNVNVIADGQTKPCSWAIGAYSSNTIKGTTNTEATRAAWQLYADQFTTSQQATDDSYIKIAAGSYLVFGDEKMTFANDIELFKGELDLQELIDLIENATIASTGATGADTYKPELFVAKGSVLAVGQSVATLDEKMTISIDASANAGDDITGKLTALKNDVVSKQAKSDKVFAAISNVVKLINDVVGIVDAADVVNTDVVFGDNWQVIRGESSVIVASNDHALVDGEVGTFVVKQAVKQVRGGKVYDINRRIGAVEAATSIELVEAEFPLVAGQPYIFKASADKLEGILEGEEVATAGALNGLIGKLAYFNVPATDGSSIYNFMIYNNEARLCGTGCYIYGGMAYINMNDVSQKDTAAPGRARYILGKGTPTMLENNVIVPAQGMEKMMVNGQLIIVKEGKMFNAQGAQL